MNIKITALLLIFILLFNYIGYTKVQAEAITLGVGFLVFVALLTTAGVTISSINDYQNLYTKYELDIGSTDFTAFKAAAKGIYQGVLETGKNFTLDWEDTNLGKFMSWVKSNFITGNNDFIYNTELVPDGEGYATGYAYFYEMKTEKYNDDPNLDDQQIWITINGVSQKLTSHRAKYITNSRFEVVNIVRSGSTINLDFTFRWWYTCNYDNKEPYNGYQSRTVTVYKAYKAPVENPYLSETSVGYVGHEVLLNPAYEPKNINFPPPPIYIPGIEENPDGRTYSGTPGQLVQELENNASAIDDMVKKYLGQNPVTVPSLGTFPTYNENDGTITFPNTTSGDIPWDIPVDSPWDIPIDIPADVPVPIDVPQGLGVIGWLLKYIAQGITGIWNLLKDLFKAPTKSLNFDSLMNLNVKEKFPFSLPWDVYNSLSLIAAPAEVPNFEIQIKDVKFNLDFTQFETLAGISRTFFTLIYVMTLVMISRRLIGGE